MPVLENQKDSFTLYIEDPLLYESRRNVPVFLTMAIRILVFTREPNLLQYGDLLHWMFANPS